MRNADDKSLPGLAGQGPAGLVDDRAGHQDGHGLVLLLKEGLDGVESGLGIGSVKNGLH